MTDAAQAATEPAAPAAPRTQRDLIDEAFAAAEQKAPKPKPNAQATEAKAGTGPEAPEKPKEPAETKAKPEPSAAEKLGRQQAALTRRMREAERRETRAQQIEQASSARVRDLESKYEALSKLEEHQLLEHVAKLRGVPMDTLLKRVIARVAGKGKLPPDEETRAELETTRQRLERLEREKQERDAAEARSREQAEEQEYAKRWLTDAVELAKANTDELPLITQLYSDAELAQRVSDVATRYIEQHGVAPEHDDVLLYLEQLEKQAEERRAEKLGARTPTKLGAVPGSEKPEPQAPRTLTNSAASERVSTKSPPTNERDLIAWAAEAIPD